MPKLPVQSVNITLYYCVFHRCKLHLGIARYDEVEPFLFAKHSLSIIQRDADVALRFILD